MIFESEMKSPEVKAVTSASLLRPSKKTRPYEMIDVQVAKLE